MKEPDAGGRKRAGFVSRVANEVYAYMEVALRETLPYPHLQDINSVLPSSMDSCTSQ